MLQCRSNSCLSRTVTIVLLLVLSEFAAVTPAGSATTAQLIYQGDFEDGTLGAFIPSGNPPVVTTEQSRSGHRAIKIFLDRQSSATSYRTEVSTRKANAEYFSDTWYGVSVFLPKSYVKSPVWEIVFQWHGVPDDANAETLNPPMSMHTGDGEWKLSTVGDSRKPASKANYESKKTFPLGSYAADMGRWTDWVFRIRWDYRKLGAGNKGQLQAWKNGELVIDEPSIQLGFNDSLGPYFKMGLYKGWRDRTIPEDTVSQRLLYLDEFRQAGADGSFDSVSPGHALPVSGSQSPRPAPPEAVTVK